ncbi:MAG TPA: HAD family hydrolase [Candidatus Binataceae bacterium]|nr:HAD family hydrolase [Candidatus Binataceae bacterium]
MTPQPLITAVVLDLFDTLVRWDPERLPLFAWRGREMRSTVPWFIDHLEKALLNRFDRETAVAAYFEVLKEVNDERERDAIEISCLDRFVRMLVRLGLGDDREVRELAEELRRLHMSGVREVTWAPSQWVEAVRQIAPHYRLGLLSNFDDSETGHQIVQDTGIAGLFDAIIISADVGLRKPHPEIFRQIAAMLEAAPAEILFVGDTPRYDVLGAHQAGMRTVWLNDRKDPLTPDIPRPEYIIKDLSELPALLEGLR